jgi:CheY-like chemotaxis protein
MTDELGGSPDRRRVRVLVVDDVAPLRRIIRLALEAAGFDVVEASNGYEAAKLFHASPADVVVTDLYMPEEDGIELIGQLREFIPRVPIVAMSGGGIYDDSTALLAAERLGADATLTKPFTPDEMVAAVRSVLGPADT